MTSPKGTWPARLLIAPIRFYQRFITPYTPATCRYYPTCSAYAVTALRRRGALVGSVLTIWRLLRCNPWSEGGVDHVPARGLRREREEATGSSCDDGSPEPSADDRARSGARDPADSADLPCVPPSRPGDTKIRRFAA